MCTPPEGDPAVHTLSSPPGEDVAPAPVEVAAPAEGAVRQAAEDAEVNGRAAEGSGGGKGDGEGEQGKVHRAAGPVAVTSPGEGNAGSEYTGSAATAAAVVVHGATDSVGVGFSAAAGGREATGDGARLSLGGVDHAPQEQRDLLPQQPLDEDFPSFEADPADLASG